MVPPIRGINKRKKCLVSFPNISFPLRPEAHNKEFPLPELPTSSEFINLDNDDHSVFTYEDTAYALTSHDT